MKRNPLIFLLSLSTILAIAGCGGNSSSSAPTTTSTTNNAAKIEQTAPLQTNGTNQGQGQLEKPTPAKQLTTTTVSSAPSNTPPSPGKGPSPTVAKTTVRAQPAAKAVHPAPAAAPVTDTKAPIQQTVSFTIIGADHKTIVPRMNVPIKSDDTILSILKEITREKGIQMEYRGAGAAAYVEGIDNVYEFDQGPKSGWMFRVNGNFGDRSCGSYAVHAGDVIQWLYSTNLGKDLGK